MRIVESYECSVHTHFVTDGQRLTARAARLVETEMRHLLLSLGIVFPLRVRPQLKGGRVWMVLECRPAAPERRQITDRLTDLLKPLPVRPVAKARPAKRARPS